MILTWLIVVYEQALDVRVVDWNDNRDREQRHGTHRGEAADVRREVPLQHTTSKVNSVRVMRPKGAQTKHRRRANSHT